MGDYNIPTLNLSIPTASQSARSWFSPVEDSFAYLGLNTPMYRLLGVSLGVAALLYGTQPESLFNGNSGKAWAVWSDESDAVLFPWWLVAMLAGLCAAVFI
jgi:hypothetical protein